MRRAGIGFCFAGRFHTSLRTAAPVRRELGIPTFFNYLGPLANPAQTDVVAAGVAFPEMGPVLSRAFAKRGTRALVFRGDDGLDEITVTDASTVWRQREGVLETVRLVPEDVGLRRAPAEALRGGDVVANSAVVRDVLGGRLHGPVRDAVLLNAAAGIAAADPGVPDVVGALRDGIDEAARALDAGAAQDVLHRWVEASRAVRRAGRAARPRCPRSPVRRRRPRRRARRSSRAGCGSGAGRRSGSRARCRRRCGPSRSRSGAGRARAPAG